MWQYDLAGSRANLTERAITAKNVGRLRLRWAFAFPFTDAASSQPAIVGNTLYVGGHNGVFYSVNARTGGTNWSFDTSTVTGPQSGPDQLRDGPAVSGGTVYFGDGQGYVYALNTASGSLRWATRLGSFAAGSYSHVVLTSSPLVWRGRVFVGVASNEESSAVFPFYSCCVFRGRVVALDATTGKVVWRHYTVSQPAQVGVNSLGIARYEPSGGAVWSSPVLDPRSGTLVVGTGNAYSGRDPVADAVLALSAQTGRVKWLRQMTPDDAWNFSCALPQPFNCPDAGPDFDFGSSPNLFTLRLPIAPRRGGPGRGRRRASRIRRVVGIGQKSGTYFLLDLATGRTIWQRQLAPSSSTGAVTAEEGVKWGTSYDGRRIYVAISDANPGRLYALDPRTGRTLWSTANPSDGCSTGGGQAYASSGDCRLAMPGAVSTSPGLVFEGSLDGKLRAFSAATGRILWQYDTVQTYPTVNQSVATGGSISGGGAVVSHGMVYVNSGYNLLDLPGSGIHGQVLLAFGLPGSGPAVRTMPSSGPRRSRAAALQACIAAWNGSSNGQAQALLRLRGPSGRLLAVQADMFGFDRGCRMTVLESSAGRRGTVRLGLVGQRFLPAPPGQAILPPDPRVWNLSLYPDGSVRLRG
jgi:polyvinyl alcohol dehydrogenase (cytochrome)